MNRILDTPEFNETLRRLAAREGIPPRKVVKIAEKYLDEMHATHNPIVDVLTDQGSSLILNQAFDQFDVVPEQIDMLRKTMKTKSVAFVVTHKTYIDTVALGVLLAKHGLPPSYTFAGINLDFIGFGSMLRRMGGIFIRRSFKDNEIYKAVLRQYIGHLISEKSSFTWAIEGTRSRTGKLLRPKLGILKYVVDGSRHLGDVEQVAYVPVSLTYDQIPDVPGLTAEIQGAKKKGEGVGWFASYLNKMRQDFGRIAVRFGEPVSLADTPSAPEAEDVEHSFTPDQIKLQKLAFELAFRINEATAVTTTSLVCITLLGQFAAKKTEIEFDVKRLMTLINNQRPGAVLEFNTPIEQSVTKALSLLIGTDVIEQRGHGLDARYAVKADSYLQAVYYANMSIHLLVHRAFCEVALLRSAEKPKDQRLLSFWAEIMRLRDLFKFEFFYSKKPIFSDRIEAEMQSLAPNWEQILDEGVDAVETLLHDSQPLVAHAVLDPYLEVYRVAAQTVKQSPRELAMNQSEFIDKAIAKGEEMHWQGNIQRIETIAKPFLGNAYLLVKNRAVLVNDMPGEVETIDRFISKLDELGEIMHRLQALQADRSKSAVLPLVESGVGNISAENIKQVAKIIRDVQDAPDGPQVAAIFDLDRTLIEGFSAVEFAQQRIVRREMSAKEAAAQLNSLMMYATGSGNFASLAAVGAKGVKGSKHEEFMAFGEDVARMHLIKEIYPEARELLAAHAAKGHTICIVSAATPYQVEPIAAELGIEHVMCTRLEVVNGRLTGEIVEPACWGEGKAIQARTFAKANDVDLDQSYFYTDSHDDLELLEIVGKPRPLNPDKKLFALATERDWPVSRFTKRTKPGAVSLVRTGLAFGSMIPTFMAGIARGVISGSRSEGVNAMIGTFGDLSTRLAGIKLNIRGEENMWAARPAVFIFNHQSGTDLLIGAKLMREDVTAIAKQELKTSVVGPLLMAGGVVFIDRSNREKAIESMQPAVDALQSGTSVAIAPEGTRSGNRTLGPFKKGAFHLAMQAGVPLVPIIIHNASDLLGKGGFVIRSGIVDVTVLEPISTEDWTKETLDENITAVRQQFLDTLGQAE